MPAIPIIAAVVSVAGTVYSASQQNKAANNAAQVDTATANYNAKYDEAQAAQLELDTRQNIRTERQDAAVYLSKQEVGYAAAGVLANTGSALDAQIKNAGRFEQKIQQDWVNMNQKQQSLYSSAKVGRLEGAAQASADRMQGKIALINGGVGAARSIFGAYQSGVFSGGGSGGGSVKSAWAGSDSSTFGAYA